MSLIMSAVSQTKKEIWRKKEKKEKEKSATFHSEKKHTLFYEIHFQETQ